MVGGATCLTRLVLAVSSFDNDHLCFFKLTSFETRSASFTVKTILKQYECIWGHTIQNKGTNLPSHPSPGFKLISPAILLMIFLA